MALSLDHSPEKLASKQILCQESSDSTLSPRRVFFRPMFGITGSFARPSSFKDSFAHAVLLLHYWDCFFFQSAIAARIASSASTEQWILTGGKESSFTISMF